MTRRLRQLLGAVLIVTAQGCAGCEADGVGGAASSFSVDRTRIDFGRVFLGAEKRETVILSAPGSLPVAYGTRLEGDAFGFQVGPAFGQVGANRKLEILVIFRPGAPGQRNAEIIFDNDTVSTSTMGVSVSGTGVLPPDCEDGNGCTVDTFDPASGRCEHVAARLACDDFDACTTNDLCVEGVCRGESFSCDDDDVCTDDLCDPRTGCAHVLTASCEDGNPCTRDSCRPQDGCINEVLADGTPCNDLEQCTISDICLQGDCIGVDVPDGSECNDFDPCSKDDQCVDGTCLDPSYHPPDIGELKFATEVGNIVSSSSENPIIDREGTVFVGVEGGVAAVDLCGEVLWLNDTIGMPRFSGATSLPGLLTVPVGGQLVDIDTRSGDVLRTLDLGVLFSPIQTSSTSTAARVQILDLALRASGSLVASVVRTTFEPELNREGILAEVDRLHVVATRFRDLGDLHASRIAIDDDEAILAILSDGRPGKGTHEQRLVRFGVGGLPETSWSTSTVLADHTDLSIGRDGAALWTAGLVSVSRTGVLAELIPAPFNPPINAGSAVVAETFYGLVVKKDAPVSGIRFGPDVWYELVALTPGGQPLWTFPLPAQASRMSPAVDLFDRAYVVTSNGQLHGVSPDGDLLFSTELPLGSDAAEHVAVGIAPDGAIIAVAGGRVFSVRSNAPLAITSWPRHRRDNLATGHR